MQREYKKHGFFSFVPQDSRNRELWCLKHGKSEINCVCRVLEVSKKNIKTKAGEKKAILTGIMADYTAKIQFVSLNEREELVRDRVVQIGNADVKKWKGLATLYMGKNATVSVIDDAIDFPTRAELMKPKKRTIKEIIGCEGAFDVILEGDIVFVSHSGEENGREIVLDDGTGAVFVDLIEKGKSILFGMPVKARGNVVAVDSKNDYLLIAEELKVKSEVMIIREAKNFLCRYT